VARAGGGIVEEPKQPVLLHLELRVLGGDAQPLTVRHFHPGISEPRPYVERLTRRIGRNDLRLKRELWELLALEEA